MSTAPYRPTILIVEDEARIREVIALLLEEEEYCVLQAGDGQTALSMLEDNQPDIIISDVRMPGMDGFTLCEQVRANPDFSRVPFIFLTGKGERADVRRGMGLGADDYLVKPFQPEELLSAVQVRLARAAQTQAAISRAGSELQDQIIRTLTHEFRTPLSLVVGYTDLLESTGQSMDETDFQAILQGLHAGSVRLMHLIEDFLLLSKLRTGVIAKEIGLMPPLPQSPDPVVHRLVELAKDHATAQNVSLITACEASDLTVAIDSHHLEEIVHRLLDNAIKFSKPGGGRVVVATRQEGNSWELSVIDEGIGIRQEALSWVFEAFRQVDRASMEQQGAGIGLSIVQGLVEANGGQVAVTSAPDQGSAFTVWLPLVAR